MLTLVQGQMMMTHEHLLVRVFYPLVVRFVCELRLLAVVDEAGAVRYSRKDGYHRETMSDLGSKGVEIHDGQNLRLKPGQSSEIKFADGSIAIVTANENKGITQNGLTGIAYTADKENILYPPFR